MRRLPTANTNIPVIVAAGRSAVHCCGIIDPFSATAFRCSSAPTYEAAGGSPARDEIM